MTARSIATTAREFLVFAPHCRPGSPLYELLAQRTAEDAELLALAAEAQPGQPAPNMLFAAAHDLLLRGAAHPAAAYYPTVGGAGAPGPAAFAAFRDLCLGRREEVRALLHTRRTQTNETRRCAYLLPGFTAAAAAAGGRPLALVEIGPSAGLNMLWDRYGYDYGAGLRCGDRGSPVQIRTELRGPGRPPIPAEPPAVAWRVGVELSPVDLGDAEAVRWLEALIWPEQVERVGRLRAAVALARATPPPIVAGDALELLPGLLAQAPEAAALCVYHTHVTYQLSAALRERLDQLLLEAGRRRPLLRLSCEGEGAAHPRLTLTSYGRGGAETRLLAVTPGHASWIAWEEG
jgi:hypothetical protein